MGIHLGKPLSSSKQTPMPMKSYLRIHHVKSGASSPTAQPTVLLVVTRFVWIFDIFPKLSKDQKGVSSLRRDLRSLLQTHRFGENCDFPPEAGVSWCDLWSRFYSPVRSDASERDSYAKECWSHPGERSVVEIGLCFLIYFFEGVPKNRVAGQGMEKHVWYVLFQYVNVYTYFLLVCLNTFALCEKYQIQCSDPHDRTISQVELPN